MNRRRFIQAVPIAGLATAVKPGNMLPSSIPPTNDRAYWASLLVRIAEPVLYNLSKGQLKKTMPLEVAPAYSKPVEKVTYLEAFGRTMAGIAPWLELGADETEEGKIRGHMIKLAQSATAQAVDPSGPDYMNFTGRYDGQPLVDGAFLAHGFIRAPKQLWEPLSDKVKRQVVAAFKSLRSIKPGYNNWLLFAAMIETALLEFGEDWDAMRVDFAIKKHQEWYKG
ncbi:MAG: hypothetical protein H6Q26_1566, partial [Bacteroidetes bacterium]|nr:hypothetical protein [Bacteroidota bacterium]